MLSNAIALAALTCAGFYMIYNKLPPRMKAVFVKYDLLTDVSALMLTYVLLGGTVTALIASALVSIVVSMLLHIAKFPNDYIWLTDSLAKVKGLLDSFKDMMKGLNQKYVDINEAKVSI